MRALDAIAQGTLAFPFISNMPMPVDAEMIKKAVLGRTSWGFAYRKEWVRPHIGACMRIERIALSARLSATSRLPHVVAVAADRVRRASARKGRGLAAWTFSNCAVHSGPKRGTFGVRLRAPTWCIGWQHQSADFIVRDTMMYAMPVLRKFTPSRMPSAIAEISGQPAVINTARKTLANPETSIPTQLGWGRISHAKKVQAAPWNTKITRPRA